MYSYRAFWKGDLPHLSGIYAENDPANDYDIERNVHYTYNVTIKGMNDLVVEAKSDKAKEEEPAPGVEGLVYDAHRSFNFDCHYEQGLMRLRKMNLLSSTRTVLMKDDAMFLCHTHTVL